MPLKLSLASCDVVPQRRGSASGWTGRSTRPAPGGAALLVLLVLLALLANFNVLDNEFLNWDDPLLVTSNPRVQMTSLGDLRRIFDPSEALAGKHLEWIPLRDSAYGLIFYFFGLDPAPFHLVQILFHALVVVALFITARPWVGERGALIGAALFAVHPIHVESVAWIAALKDPTFTAALLFSITLWQRARMATAPDPARNPAPPLAPDRGPGDDGGGPRLQADRHRPAGSAAAGGVGISPPVIAPAPDRRGGPLCARGPGRAGAVRGHRPPERRDGRSARGHRLPRFSHHDHGLCLLPGEAGPALDLSARYLVTPVTTVLEPRFLLAALVIVAVWGAAVALVRRTRLPLFALGWYTIALLPVMNIIPIPIEMADRYLYLPSVGVLVAAGAGLGTLLEHRRALVARGAAAVTALLLVGWTGASVARNDVWQDDVTLWRSVVERSPEFYIGRTNLASALLARGDVVGGERELRAAIATNPRHATALLNLGQLLRQQNRPAEAQDALERAIAARPDYGKAYNNLATLLMDRKQWAAARSPLERALAIDPEHPTALRNLAVVCVNLQDAACAVRYMRRAIDARPANRALFLEWLALLRHLGRETEASGDGPRIERFFPRDAEVRARHASLMAATR